MIKKFVSVVLVLALIFAVATVPSSAAVGIDDLGAVAIVSSLVLICGFTFADYQANSSFASDLWNKITALPDRFGSLIDGIRSLTAEVYDSVSNVVSISGDLLQQFISASEDVLDVSIYPLVGSPSISYQNNFVFPVMKSMSLSNGTLIYSLNEPLSLSSIPNGQNLLYTSDLASLYLYKESDTYQLIGKVGSRYYRLTNPATASSTSASFGTIFLLLNSSGTGVTIDNWVNSGYAETSSSKPSLNPYFVLFDSSGDIDTIFGFCSGNYRYSSDFAKVIGTSTNNNSSMSVLLSDSSIFSASYLGNHLHRCSFDNIIDFEYSATRTSVISQYYFDESVYFPMMVLSVSMGLNKGIGTYDPVNVDVPIYQNPVVSGSDESLLDILVPMPNIDIKYPSNVNSPDNVLPLNPVDLVVSEIDIPDPVPPSEPSAPVIPDIDTSGILHYITDFFESIADFFSFLFGLIGSLPTSLTYPIFGAFLLLVMIGIIIICL